MTLRFLGTGGAFDSHLGNSAAILEWGKQRLLIDCGHAVYPRLQALKLADHLTGILLTHTHDDHVGSLGSLLAHQRYIGGKQEPMPIYYPTETFREHLKGYLSYVLGDLAKYVAWRPLSALSGSNALETTGYHAEGVLSFAYAFTEEEVCLAYSGDLGDPHVLYNWLINNGYKRATVFQDITFDSGNLHHTHYKKLEPYLTDFRIFGYHCDPMHKPADCKVVLVAEHKELLL